MGVPVDPLPFPTSHPVRAGQGVRQTTHTWGELAEELIPECWVLAGEGKLGALASRRLVEHQGWEKAGQQAAPVPGLNVNKPVRRAAASILGGTRFRAPGPWWTGDKAQGVAACRSGWGGS